MLELRHLRLLQTLASAGSVSAAAQRVHLSQSALSHQLLGLEAHYGLRLFERKPLRWTSAGLALLNLAETILPTISSTERTLAKLSQGEGGQLRIAVECHTCFEWLMPAMDTLREQWPAVELDLLSGFHTHPLALLDSQQADLVLVAKPENSQQNWVFHPLFRFEILAVLSRRHPLAEQAYLTAADFAQETLITYPAPAEKLDLLRDVLLPAGINPPRRTAELTVAILQLVASRRGIAALPSWGVTDYLARGYIVGKPIGEKGLWSDLYAATTQESAQKPYMVDFIHIIREQSFARLPNLQGI